MQASHISGINVSAFMARSGQEMLKVQALLGKEIMPAAYEALTASMRDLTSKLPTGALDNMPKLDVAHASAAENRSPNTHAQVARGPESPAIG